MNKIGATVTSLIIPVSILLIITLLCIGTVEGFYHILGKKLRYEQPQVEQPAVSQPTAMDPASVEPAPAGEERRPINPETSVITDRNLFASRTGDLEIVSEEEPAEVIEPSSLAIVLMGTVTGPDEQQRAIIYDEKIGRQELYEKGDYIQQAAISQILRGKVIISIDGKNEMLDISEARNVNVPVVAPQPAVAPVSTLRRVIGRPVGAERIVQPNDRLVVEPVQNPDSASPGEVTTQ
ncbi:MAG: hypothetical protein IH612_08880 [Desulfofustis sp.]|nr:hypothetical protein [Desulfofustis sp.]